MKHSVPVTFFVPDTDTSECPVADITPRSYDVVQLFATANRVNENNGAALYGSDLSEWPGWAVDAARILETQHIRFENARLKAENETR
jgi:hypothetical protein